MAAQRGAGSQASFAGGPEDYDDDYEGFSERFQDDEDASPGNVPDPSLNQVLRIMAETMRAQASRGESSNLQRGRVLSQIKFPEYNDSPGTTTKSYKTWRKQIDFIQKINGLNDQELGMLLYTSVTGRAKQLIELIEIEQCMNGTALQLFMTSTTKLSNRCIIRDSKSFRKSGIPRTGSLGSPF